MNTTTMARARWVTLAMLALLFGALVMAAGAGRINAQALDPATVEADLEPGESVEITKTVTTPAIPPNPDIVFLADTTGSMGGALANVQANATMITNTVVGSQPTAQFAVAQYRDTGDGALLFNVDQDLTDDETAVQTAIGTWAAGGGGDDPEAQLNALFEISTGAVSFRSDSTRIVVWFGDAPGHDPSNGHSQADVIAALQAEDIAVIAIPVVTGAGGLDSTGQATAIANATGGDVLAAATPDEVADAILEGLQNLSVEVSMESDCTTPIGTSFDPDSQTIVSGEDAVFTETISADADAEPGTYECRDWALINGEPMTDDTGEIIYETKTITVLDVIPPVAECSEGVNPAGNTPRAGQNSPGQNEDGFYLLSASDNFSADEDLQIFVTDTGSGTVFGPYPVGTNIKYTQAPGATPNEKPGQGEVDVHITGTGDAQVTAVDEAGNVSDPVDCLVPPQPK